MSRTYRSNIPFIKRGAYRKPRSAGAIRASSDEYGIRNKSIPPNSWDDLEFSSMNEDKSFLRKRNNEPETI